MITGGGAVIWAHGTFRDPDGFLISQDVNLQVESYAIVQRDVDIDMDVNVPTSLWSPEMSDFVTVKLVGESNDPSKEVFIGIAMRDDVMAYLDGELDEIQHRALQKHLAHCTECVKELDAFKSLKSVTDNMILAELSVKFALY